VSGEDVPVSVLESQFKVFDSMGLVVIYSCDALSSEARLKLSAVAANRFFDLSSLQLVAEESDAVRKVLSLLHSLRVVADHRDHGKIT